MGRLDLILFLTAFSGLVVIALRFATVFGPLGDDTKILILHLIPLATALMTQGALRAERYRSASSGISSSAATSYRPIPLNKEVERLSWDDLIIPQELRGELCSVIELLRDPSTAKRYGIDIPKGILLSGPPGTGKTTIAKVVANQAKLSFFTLKLDEVISKWVGESEKNLTMLFEAAQRHAPSVIFVDEVDSIGKTRSNSDGQAWRENVLNHLLQLIDGVIKTERVYVIAATNRADLVDPALKRAGRLDREIEVALPDLAARTQLFQLYLSKLAIEGAVNVQELAKITDGKSCADIKQVCNQAGLNAFKREFGTKSRQYQVTRLDLENALFSMLMGARPKTAP